LPNRHERRVIAWYKSRETFAEAWRKQFAQLLGTHGVLCFEGFQLAYRVRRDPVGWLRPTAIVTAVGALVAPLTGLSTIQDWGYSLLAIPDCTLWTDPVAAAKPKAVGEPFGIQVQVKNRHLRASSTATIKPVLIGDGLKPTDDTNSYPVRVEPGKAEVQEFRFTNLEVGTLKEDTLHRWAASAAQCYFRNHSAGSRAKLPAAQTVPQLFHWRR
jgi:hypothetical protein